MRGCAHAVQLLGERCAGGAFLRRKYYDMELSCCRFGPYGRAAGRGPLLHKRNVAGEVLALGSGQPLTLHSCKVCFDAEASLVQVLARGGVRGI